MEIVYLVLRAMNLGMKMVKTPAQFLPSFLYHQLMEMGLYKRYKIVEVKIEMENVLNVPSDTIVRETNVLRLMISVILGMRRMEDANLVFQVIH